MSAPSTTVFHYLRAVLWSFFGIRRRNGAQADIEGLSPIVLIATGIALAACFVLVLLTVAHWAVSSH